MYAAGHEEFYDIVEIKNLWECRHIKQVQCTQSHWNIIIFH